MKKDKIKSYLEVIAISFMLNYGIWYFGSIFRKLYYSFNNTFFINSQWYTVIDYLGHIVILLFYFLYAFCVKKDGKYIFSFLNGKFSRNTRFLIYGLLIGCLANCICTYVAVLTNTLSIDFVNKINVIVFIFAFIAVLVQASVEEIADRGFLFGRLIDNKVPMVICVVVTGFAFSLSHISNPGYNFLAFLNLGLSGAKMGLLYYYSGTIWLAFGVHTAWNFTQSFIFGLENSGEESILSVFSTHVNNDNIWYDANFGLEATLTYVFVNILIIVLTIIIGRKFSKHNLLKAKSV